MTANKVSDEVVGRVLKLFLEKPTKFIDYMKIRRELPKDSESSIRRALQELEKEGI
jgi:DNA-binding HxlR family transcriptional regulator